MARDDMHVIVYEILLSSLMMEYLKSQLAELAFYVGVKSDDPDRMQVGCRH